MKNSRIAPPEFWRFIFILFVCLLHFEEDVYSRIHIIANAGYLGVDFFLILSGFVVAYNHDKKPIKSVMIFAWNRVKRLYPDFLFAIILMFGLWLIFDNDNGFKGILVHIRDTKFQYFFINAFYPTSLEMRSIWFLSYWLVGIIVLAFTLKNNKLPVLGGVIISFMSWHVYNQGTLFGDSSIPEYLWSLRLMKSVSQVVIGALAYETFKLLYKVNFTKAGIVLLSAIEILVVLFVVVVMARKGRNMLDYEVCIGFFVIIIFAFLKKSALSILLDNKLSIFLGKLSLPIYLYHLFVIKFVSICWYNYPNKFLLYSVSIVAILVLSFIFHLFVEKGLQPMLKCCVKKIVVTEND